MCANDQFVQPKLLHRWTIKPAAISGSGNEIDDGLVELARRLRCPLISNEGLVPTVRLETTEYERTPQSPGFQRHHKLYNDVQRFLGDVFDYHQKLLYGTEPDAIAERRELVGAERAAKAPPVDERASPRPK